MTNHLEFKTLKINTPYVVHETIEGETIAMNLRDGNYYSFDGIGPAIWDMISETVPYPEMIRILTEATHHSAEEIAVLASSFINELAENDLIIVSDIADNEAHLRDKNPMQFGEKYAGLEPKKPVFHRYSDMQDILLLDPIHDVDAVGWPEPKVK